MLRELWIPVFAGMTGQGVWAPCAGAHKRRLDHIRLRTYGRGTPLPHNRVRTVQILVSLLASLGFIFIGTHFLTENMKKLAGVRFRRIVRTATRHPAQAALVGIGAGAAIQSTNAVTFIVVGLVSAGAVTVQAAMPIVTWCYAGTTLRLLLVSIDVAALTYALVALVGLAYATGHHKSPTHGYLVNALMGLALLMVGVDQTAQAAAQLSGSEVVRGALALADHFYLWGFLAGTALASVMQGMTVSVIAIALVQAGLLGPDQAMLIVVGANVGSGVMSWMQGASLRGTERQLSVYQVCLKAIGALVLLPLLAVEHYAGVPTVTALVRSVTGEIAFQVTLVHWLFQVVAALAASLFKGPLYALVLRLSPPSQEEELSRPLFLYRAADDTAEAAAGRVEQEHGRLLHRLGDFLAPARPEEHAGPAAGPAVLQRAGKALAGEIDLFLRESLTQAEPGPETDRLLRLCNANDLLAVLQEEVAAFVRALPARGVGPEADRIAAALSESMHALLATVALELDDEDFDPELLASLTADRAATMHRVREALAAHAPPLPAETRLALWKATDLFERVNWLLRRYAWSRGTLAPPEDAALPVPVPA